MDAEAVIDKLDELCKDVRALHTADKVLPEDDNLLDNQDLCLLEAIKSAG